MNNLNRKKITVALSILLVLVAVFGTFTYMNKAKASGYDTIDGVEWLFDIVDEKATNLYISKDVETSTITIPTEVTYKNVTYPVVSVGKTNVSNESSLFFGSLEPNTTVSFAQKDGKTSITKINAYAFCGCTNIQSVNIPDSVTEIGDYAFYNCINMTTATGIENVETLGNSAFEGCEFLMDVTLNKTTTFGSKIFDNCSCLRLTITNPNMDLSDQNFVPARLIGYENSTAKEYHNKKNFSSNKWVSLDGTTKTDGTTYPKSFKVMVKTDTDVTVASGLFKDYFYGLAGKEVSDLTECATKPYYALDGYYLGTDDNAECYYTYDKTNDKMITKKSTFSADYADDIMKLTPKFTPKSYDIFYSLNGGQWKKGVSADLENTNKEQYVYSVGKVLNTNVEKRGYLFTGWYADINNPVVLTTKVTDTEHGLKSFLAKWSPIHYDIKFDKNTADAGSMTGQNIAYDTTTALTKNGYTKKGYSFNGWNTKADGSGTKYADEADVTNLSYTDGDTITLYAQWSANPYKLTFDANKGSCSEASRMVKYDSTYGVLPTATRIGYTFAGWYTPEDNGVKVTKDTVMQSVYGETVYAHWNANSYNIRFDGNKASNGSMDAEYILYDETKPLTANAYKKTGYTFAGWNTKADGSGKTYHDEDNVLNLATNGVITLYAQWSANHYSVVFDRNHATGGVVGAVSMIYDQSRQLPANGFTRTGYQFDGWNTKADGSGQSYKDKAYVTNLATSGVTTLYAQWKPLTDTRYTVYYAYEGIPGQQNTGWFETQRRGTTDTMVKPDLSMFAKTGFITPETEELKIKPDGSSEAFYTFKRQQYTITVNDNDKKIKKWNAPKTAYYEEKVDVSFETNAGYQAAGITTDSIALEDVTQTTAHFTMPASDITLTAKADPLKYTISYEMNHGINSGNAVTEYTYGDTVALPDASTMSLPGFVFDGWYTKESFDGEPVTHILPDTIGNKTFWAKWVSGNYKVTLDAQGGTIKDGNVTEYTYYTGAKLPTNVVKDGYSFLGWWDGYKTATEIGNTEYGDKTYVALWADNSSTAYTYVDGDTVNLYDVSQAVAMTETIDTKNTGYYYTQLSANAKKAYATLFANYRFVPEERTIKKMNALIFTSDVELSKKDLLDAQMAFVYDHPEVFWVTYFAKSDVNNVSGVNTGKHYYMYSPVMAYDVALCKGDAEAYYGYLNMALNAMDLKKSDTTYDKVKKIHDYIIKNYSYSTYGYKLNGKTADDTRSVGRMLTMKRGCCVGYSKLMKAFCDYYGISCTLVSGTDHMWNAIQINGKWYALDVTWDDTDGKQKNSKEQYQYFLKGEKTFLADVSHRVVNCMFIQDKVPITEYACLTAPILEKGDYGTQTSVKKSTANTKITVRSGVKYKITHTKKKTAAVIGASSKSIKKAVIAKAVKINKKTYKVTAISKNAFKNCKKLKKVIIQQGKLSIGKNAFKGINKKAAFKVPKKNLKSYKKMLSKAKTGCKKTMKIAGWKVKK